MSDLRTELERAGRMAPPLEHEAFEGLRGRRDRKARRGRVTAATVSLTWRWSRSPARCASSTLPPGPSRRPLAAGPTVDLTVPAGRLLLPAPGLVQRPEPHRTASRGRRITRPGPGTGSTTRAASSRPERRPDRPTRTTPGNFAQDTGDLTYLSTDPSQLLPQMTERMQPNGRSPEPFDQFTPGPGQDGHATAGPGALDRRAAERSELRRPRSRPRCSRSRAVSRGWR